MLVIPGQRGKDNCDGIVSRRELLRIGGSSMLGLDVSPTFSPAKARQRKPAPAGPDSAKPRA